VNSQWAGGGVWEHGGRTDGGGQTAPGARRAFFVNNKRRIRTSTIVMHQK
jgi:hypothetical protein